MNNLTLLIAILFLTASPSVFAYLDPGSGSAIMSAVVGAFVAMSLVIKTYFYKIKSFFIKTKPTETDTPNDQDLSS
ncbi:hypothetical protein [Oceanicoccus sp. KOV_DT_Chl]|uniref:hypothetical protein n=1 Tax=Oceanicoccus sp. KOV_DT_Chl TaxID=1904639 RepID=UPI000C7B3FD5|nr:hypothetical protein [Oceanicoccus sp. KOV_DT_Chl]